MSVKHDLYAETRLSLPGGNIKSLYKCANARRIEIDKKYSNVMGAARETQFKSNSGCRRYATLPPAKPLC